ncbi:MAG: thiosulfate oxidation carrier protein SoxY [Methylococcales bacterium]|nr:thiosulfate oxidation carrier protein SoxY [Methylococcales bacterium]
MFSIAVYGLAVSSNFVCAKLADTQWLEQSFQPSSYKETLKHLFKGVRLIKSKRIKFSRLPRVAENGSIVPITVASSLKNVNKISILVKKNPIPLIAEFHLSPAVEARVSARFKMAKTSDVIAIIEADGKFYFKSKKVVVAVGGCGS